MFIEEKYLPIALETVEKAKRDAAVSFDAHALREYKAALKGIAEVSRYKEQDKISQSDLDVVKGHFQALLDSVADHFAAKSDAARKNTDPVKHVMAAHDYLFAMAMEALHCPEIPDDALRPTLADCMSKLVRSQPEYEIPADEYFDAQRGKDAETLLESRVGTLLLKAENRTPDPEELGELFAEYSALKQRQANHNAIWRFFHRDEQAARAGLIERMEKGMQRFIPKESLERIKSPKEAADFRKWSLETKRMDMEIERREAMPYFDFGYGNYKDHPALFEEYMKNRAEERRIAEENEKMPLSERLNRDLNQTAGTETSQKAHGPSVPTLGIDID